MIGRRPSTWLLRDVLEECDDYQCALKNLAYTPISSLAYYMLAGGDTDEGVVITRGFTGPAYFDFLDTENGKWYVAQTNHDTWKDYNTNLERGTETMLIKAKE